MTKDWWKIDETHTQRRSWKFPKKNVYFVSRDKMTRVKIN